MGGGLRERNEVSLTAVIRGLFKAKCIKISYTLV